MDRKDEHRRPKAGGRAAQQRCASLRGQPDDAGAAQLSEAGCRAGRKPAEPPPGATPMRRYLRGRPLGGVALLGVLVRYRRPPHDLDLGRHTGATEVREVLNVLR